MIVGLWVWTGIAVLQIVLDWDCVGCQVCFGCLFLPRGRFAHGQELMVRWAAQQLGYAHASYAQKQRLLVRCLVRVCALGAAVIVSCSEDCGCGQMGLV